MKLGNYEIKNDLFYLGIKALIRNNHGEILILRDNQQTPKGINTRGYWDLPGGRVQSRKSDQETLKRELEEELGITEVKIGKMLLAKNGNFYKDLEDGISLGLIVFVYKCQIPEGSQIILSQEHDQFGWFPPQKAAELLSIKYPKELVEVIANL